MTLTPKTLKQLWIILLVEIITVPIVISFFKFIEPKKLAAVFAATLFIIVGFGILQTTRKWPDAYASFVYWLIHVHLFVFAIPMFVGRLAFWHKSFEQIKFLIFKGPEFHKLSEKFYMLLIIGTIIDIITHTLKARRLKRKTDV